MFAIIKTGGKQYRVSAGSIIQVEKIDGNGGDIVSFKDVLMVGDGGKISVGSPLINGASVSAEVLEQKRDKKVIIFKKIRRHNYRRKNGHRQHLSVVKIKEIVLMAN